MSENIFKVPYKVDKELDKYVFWQNSMPGDTVYLEFLPGMIAEVTINEIYDVVMSEKRGKEEVFKVYLGVDKPSVREYFESMEINIVDFENCIVGLNEASSFELLESSLLMRREIWIDFPLGHELVDYCWGCYPTLNEAIANADVSRKRDRNRAHKKFRSEYLRRFNAILDQCARILNQPPVASEKYKDHLCFNRDRIVVPETKVYIRRK